MTNALKLAALAACLFLGACATSATTGDYTLFGVDTHVTPAQVAVDVADVQKAINALPALCSDFAVAASLTQAEMAVLQSGGVGLPAKTVANISNASAKGLLICKGTAAVVAPAAAAAAAGN